MYSALFSKPAPRKIRTMNIRRGNDSRTLRWNSVALALFSSSLFANVPPSQYVLTTGIYDLATGQRLPVRPLGAPPGD
jgi:hypothetical protein